MNDRDTFAAAALTGLLAEGDDGSFSEESYARAAYRWADAMLDFRDSQFAKETNHDAAPAATATADRYARRAAADVGGDRTDKAAPQPCEGTGDILDDYSEWLSRLPKTIGTHSPDCHRWHDKCMIIRLAEELKQTREYRDLAESDAAIARLAADSVMKRAETATTEPRNGAISDGPDPDSRVWETQRIPPPHATPPQGSVPGEGSVPDSRKWNEPVAWWLRGTEYDTGCEYEYVSLVKESAEAAAKGGGTVTPLYRAPTLTDEEREAINVAMHRCDGPEFKTLRKMLERLA